MVNIQDSNPQIKSALLINGYLKLDDDLISTIDEWVETYSDAPEELLEVHMTHYYVMSMV